MLWNVACANPHTGEEQVLSIDADSAAEAEENAREVGWLVSAVYPANANQTPATRTPEACANCGHVIGKLETAMVWNDQTVCARCHADLQPSRNVAHALQRPASQPKKKNIQVFVAGWVFILAAISLFVGSLALRDAGDRKASAILSMAEYIGGEHDSRALGNHFQAEINDELSPSAPASALNADAEIFEDQANDAHEESELRDLEKKARKAQVPFYDGATAMQILSGLSGLAGIMMVLYWIGDR